MHYNTKTTLTFSFNFPLNCDSQTEAEDKIKDLISSGNIKITLPTGYSNLDYGILSLEKILKYDSVTRAMNPSYPSNLTSEQWKLLSGLIPAAKKGGRKRSVDMEAVF